MVWQKGEEEKKIKILKKKKTTANTTAKLQETEGKAALRYEMEIVLFGGDSNDDGADATIGTTTTAAMAVFSAPMTAAMASIGTATTAAIGTAAMEAFGSVRWRWRRLVQRRRRRWRLSARRRRRHRLGRRRWQRSVLR